MKHQSSPLKLFFKFFNNIVWIAKIFEVATLFQLRCIPHNKNNVTIYNYALQTNCHTRMQRYKIVYSVSLFYRKLTTERIWTNKLIIKHALRVLSSSIVLKEDVNRATEHF